jgi:hypothetical protein
MPEIDKLEQQVGSIVAIKKINCEVNADICSKVGIKGVLLF